jgi:hypothetical protein
VTGPDLAQDHRQHVVEGGADEPQPERRHLAPGDPAAVVGQPPRLLEEPVRPLEHGSPGGGERDPPAGPQQQGVTERVLHPPDPVAQPRLAQVQPGRGPAEVQLLTQDHQQAHVVETERTPVPPSGAAFRIGPGPGASTRPPTTSGSTAACTATVRHRPPVGAGITCAGGRTGR